MIKKLVPLLMVLVLTACTASPSESPSYNSTPSLISQPASMPCIEDTQFVNLGYVISEPGTEVELLWRVEFVPWWVRTSSDGRVMAVGDAGDTIFELEPDGSLGIVYRSPGVMIETAVAASDGALWFASRDGGRLYRVDPDGTVSILAQSGNRNLEAGLDGSVYAMENGLVRIDPDGTITTISDSVFGRHFAIGPNGEIVVLSDGNIVRISEAGEITQVASGYGPEPWLTFGPDGLLYVTHWTGVDVIDLETGTVSSIAWLENRNISEAGAFTPDGRLLLYHPNTDVYAIDLVAQTVEIYYDVVSNSWAMAVNPGDAVYIAFGNNLDYGETTIYRVVDERTLEPVTTVPYGIERSMAFDLQGMGYLGVWDRGVQGGAIIQFDPASGEVVETQPMVCFPGPLTVDPQSGRLWWEECNRFVSMDENGSRVEIEGVPGGQGASLAITQAGEFYTITFFERTDPGQPLEHRLYRWNASTLAWEEVADLTQSDPAISLSILVACPDGKIYTVESLDPSHLPLNLNRSSPSMNAVRRLESDSSLTLLGFDFAYDGLTAVCDPATNRIIFTSGAGIFALTPP